METSAKIYQQVQRLPEPLANEVLDFVEYLEVKHGLRNVYTDNMQAAQEPVMQTIWDNATDEIWNDA